MEIKANDIMNTPVETVRAQDSIRDVAQLFTEKNMSAAAVLDAKGIPMGVITKTDIVRFENETGGIRTMNKNEKVVQPGFHADGGETVEQWMTPVIFSVKPDTPMKEIARRMVRYGIHHIFVRRGVAEPISGIVSSFDILRKVAKLKSDQRRKFTRKS